MSSIKPNKNVGATLFRDLPFTILKFNFSLRLGSAVEE